MENVTIRSIRFLSANKEGRPYLDQKNQRPQQLCFLETSDGRKMSGFVYNDSPALKWNPGDAIDIEVKQNGQYTNFRVPKYAPQTGNAQLDRIEAALAEANETLNLIADTITEKEKPVNSTTF